MATEVLTETTQARISLDYESTSALPDGFMSKARKNRYRNMCEEKSFGHAVSLFAFLSFLATPSGVWCILVGFNFCGGFIGSDFARSHPGLTILIASGITATFSVGTFVPFARIHDMLYRDAAGMRCQTKKTHDVDSLNRSEVRLAVLNLCIAAFVTSVVVVGKVLLGYGKFYTNVSDYGWGYLFVSSALYFVFIDLWAYVAHRALHLPFLYKTVHKWHHAYKQPTAFSGLGLHPVDMLLFQGGVYLGLYIIPLHISGIVVNLLYIHYHNVIDHSGVYHESKFPWQPSSLFHDDHHQWFHVNYGQTFTFWDEICGTFYKEDKKYTEKTFSW